MLHTYKLKKIGTWLCCCLLLAGCNKYLDVTPKGFTLLETVSDYDQWLNSPTLSIFANFGNTYAAFSDLADKPSITNPPSNGIDLAYVWAPQYATDADLWGLHYDQISAYNSVINGIDEASGGTEQQKKSLKAEALLGRANEYFYLINVYGKPYDSATAAQDPGVQLVTSDDVGQQLPVHRSSVKEIYDFMIADLNTALLSLPDDNSNNRIRGSKGAAYSLLARIYFYARNYDKALENARQALERSPGAVMIDYNKINAVARYPTLSIRPDGIYSRVDQAGFTPSLDFMQRYDPHDMRVKLNYIPGAIPTQRGGTNYYFGGFIYGSYDNAGTTVQEMKLIIAEVSARKNELAAALQQLNEVRINRIQTAFYAPFQSGDPEAILRKIWDERCFEFPSNGLRWLDMRRLDAEGRMPAVNRYDAQGNIIATLAPHSPRYTLQVPERVLQYNPGMEQNP